MDHTLFERIRLSSAIYMVHKPQRLLGDRGELEDTWLLFVFGLRQCLVNI